MKFIKFFFLLLMLFFCNTMFAQFKYEKEVRLKSTHVPTGIFAYVNSLVPSVRVRWYKQYGFESNSFEAKFKHKRQSYSVEFHENETLKDVEVLIRVADIDTEVYAKIDRKLRAELSEYRIIRLQLQIVASQSQIAAYFKDKSSIAALEQNYEIVLWTRRNDKLETYEYLFDSDANCIKKLAVIESIDDNLIY